jgi:uncharacterized protein YfeS
VKDNYQYDEEDFYGILPHPRAIELAHYGFFWSSIDELAPFGSDEGYDGLTSYQDWKEINPNGRLKNFIEWTLQQWLRPEDKYDQSILEDENIGKLVNDPSVNIFSDVFNLDTSIISAGFGQLILDGKIDQEAKLYIELALKRRAHTKLYEHITDDVEYINKVKLYSQVLNEILKKA